MGIMRIPPELVHTGDPTHRDYWLWQLRELAEEYGSTTSAEVRGRQARFLAELATTNATSKAAGKAGITPNTTSRWANEDPVFAQCRDLAREAYADRLIAEGTRRAVDGIEVIIRDRNGEEVGVERKYSDDLLKFLLRGLDKQRRWDRTPASATASNEEWRRQLRSIFEDADSRALLDQLANKAAGA